MKLSVAHMLVAAFTLAVHSALPACANPLDEGSIPVNECSSLRFEDQCAAAPLSAEDNMEENSIALPELSVTRRLALPPQESAALRGLCEGEFSIAYFQAGDEVRVETEIANDTCGASHGAYAIKIRTVGDDGRTATRSFPESWARRGSEMVQQKLSYPIALHERLVWVRIDADPHKACRCE